MRQGGDCKEMPLLQLVTLVLSSSMTSAVTFPASMGSSAIIPQAWLPVHGSTCKRFHHAWVAFLRAWGCSDGTAGPPLHPPLHGADGVAALPASFPAQPTMLVKVEFQGSCSSIVVCHERVRFRV